ncbi:tRNA-(ms[2]io[6]A)-hydroxylase [Litorivivens lipolytica]|uniref:tRNA-(Ms[2]io[6]A)-hydroxylase n=1 Tax=Litorivivens lipolytica TaxID=1524264 RepID=A0A7W4W3W4_9GAMM|nr:tRNA-(ms[2]io[6]A)-hydroxylase [Litorivivens lipolytica]MBB3046422.1 tRNA-(ms[2]io[6]A)-hydroxylase [Litorivivens lipolytica]
MKTVDIQPVKDFLACETPQAWLQTALENQSILLIDHANCEKKAASTALNLMYRYVDKPDLLTRMSKLAREELRHFEQVLAIMQQRNVDYVQLSSARYAGGLREHMRTSEPGKLIDVLIVGAFIEARSCERFDSLAPLLDEELAEFYRSLLRSESRHFMDYLKLAKQYAKEAGVDAAEVDRRVAFFAEKEAELIQAPDREFRFHSGPLN